MVLLDIMLPGVNGLDILKQIKQNPQTKDIKVVLLTKNQPKPTNLRQLSVTEQLTVISKMLKCKNSKGIRTL